MSDPALIDGGDISRTTNRPTTTASTPHPSPPSLAPAATTDIAEPEPAHRRPGRRAGRLAQPHDRRPSLRRTSTSPPARTITGNGLHERSFIDRTLWLELCKEVDAYTYSYDSPKVPATGR